MNSELLDKYCQFIRVIMERINAHFEELKDIFITCGNISENKYLFLGDYVGMDYQHLFY
jgi:hypothetical protein